MIFFIRHEGKEYTVRVESRNQQLMVKFDQEPEQPVDLLYFGHDCSFVQDGRVFCANVAGQKTDYTVWLPQVMLNLSVESEYKRIVTLLRGQELGSENNVYAKMPGKIVKVMAKVGDKIEKNHPVIVMEAMKMENEIRTGLAGEVTNVCVKEGQAVETGALLMEMKTDGE